MTGLLAFISILHPGLALAGLAAGAIPVVIHLINRRRHRRVRWAAMTFLQQAIRRRARRLRLEQWLLLAIRAGILILLGLALARPFLGRSRLLPVAQTRTHRVLLVDNSGSMLAGAPSGANAFEEARKSALTLLDSIDASDAVSIVTLAAPATTVLGYASFDRREARDRLALLTPTQRGTDLVGGLKAAEEILNESPAAPGNRLVYLFSDMAGAAWSAGGELKNSLAVEAARRVAQKAALVVAPVVTASGPNVGVSRLEASPGAVAARVPVRFSAEVTNFGAEEVRGAVLQVRRNERIERRISLPRIPPRGRQATSFLIEFESPGTHALAAHLETDPPDVLALDNDRFVSVNVAGSLPVLIVGGTQSGEPLATETGYLATALNPWRETQGLISPKVISDLELGGEVLADYRVIALCNVGRLSEEIWKRLRGYVEAGGGLVHFSGEAVDVEHYNQHAFAEGNGLLPGSLGAAVKPADGGVSFKADELVHPVFAEFAPKPGSGLFLARFERYTPIEPRSPGEVIVRYTNGAPAIALIRIGAGQSCFVTSTANMEWNNLPAKGDYVSLAMNLVTYLSQPAQRSRNLEVGEPIVRLLSAGEASLPLRVQLPSGATVDTAVTVVGSSPGAGQGLSMRYTDTEQSGVYRTIVGASANATVEGVAVNPPLSESDTRPVEEPELAQAIGAPLTFARSASDLTRNAGLAAVREVGPEALYLILALLLVETWLAMRFGSNR